MYCVSVTSFNTGTKTAAAFEADVGMEPKSVVTLAIKALVLPDSIIAMLYPVGRTVTLTLLAQNVHEKPCYC